MPVSQHHNRSRPDNCLRAASSRSEVGREGEPDTQQSLSVPSYQSLHINAIIDLHCSIVGVDSFPARGIHRTPSSPVANVHSLIWANQKLIPGKFLIKFDAHWERRMELELDQAMWFVCPEILALPWALHIRAAWENHLLSWEPHLFNYESWLNVGLRWKGLELIFLEKSTRLLLLSSAVRETRAVRAGKWRRWRWMKLSRLRESVTKVMMYLLLSIETLPAT